MKTVDILIRSCARHVNWVKYCVEALWAYGEGYRKIVLVVPKRDARAFRPLSNLLERTNTSVYTCASKPNDYLAQLVTKLYANSYSDADYIAHVDSDCILSRSFNFQHLIEGGKSPLYYRKAKDHQESYHPIVSDVTKMFEHRDVWPPIYPSWLYSKARVQTAAYAKCPSSEYVLKQPYFDTFSILDTCALRYNPGAFMHNPKDPEVFVRFRSMYGITTKAQTRIYRILSGVSPFVGHPDEG